MSTCRLWPEMTQGPYHRALHVDRAEVAEGCEGLPLRLELELRDATDERPLPGVAVEIWHADAQGRYSGFEPYVPPPGQELTAESVPTEVVRPQESFLRGRQRTDTHGRCRFVTIYPGWYASRTVHIHMIATTSWATHTTQLYFDDALTDTVFRTAPYRDRPKRDTRNSTDSIYAEGGERTVLDVTGDLAEGLTATLYCLLDPRAPG